MIPDVTTLTVDAINSPTTGVHQSDLAAGNVIREQASKLIFNIYFKLKKT